MKALICSVMQEDKKTELVNVSKHLTLRHQFNIIIIIILQITVITQDEINLLHARYIITGLLYCWGGGAEE